MKEKKGGVSWWLRVGEGGGSWCVNRRHKGGLGAQVRVGQGGPKAWNVSGTAAAYEQFRALKKKKKIRIYVVNLYISWNLGNLTLQKQEVSAASRPLHTPAEWEQNKKKQEVTVMPVVGKRLARGLWKEQFSRKSIDFFFFFLSVMWGSLCRLSSKAIKTYKQSLSMGNTFCFRLMQHVFRFILCSCFTVGICIWGKSTSSVHVLCVLHPPSCFQ